MKKAGLILLAAPAVIAASPQSDRAAIQSQNARLSRAFEHNDFRAWNRIMADDLRGYATDGTTYGKAFLMKMAKRERGWALPPVRTNIRYSRIEVHGNRGTAHGDESTCYTVKLRSGGREPLCYYQSSNDEWRKERGVWKLVAMHDLPGQRFTLAGKPISHRQFRKAVGLK